MKVPDVQLSVRKPNKMTYLNSISTRRDIPFLPAFLIRCILLRPICHPGMQCIRHVYFRGRCNTFEQRVDMLR